MTEEKRLRLEERVQASDLGRLFKSEEKLKGKIFEVNQSKEFALVDLERGGRCRIELSPVAEYFEAGEEAEVVFMPGLSRYQGAAERDLFCISFPYFKQKFPELSYGEEAEGTVLIRGSKAIYVVLDEDKEIIGCYAPPYAVIPQEFCNLKSGDKVLCLCDTFRSYAGEVVSDNSLPVKIFDLIKLA